MRLREQIVKANLLVREASYIAEELDKRTEYKVTLQIPASSLDANRKVRLPLRENQSYHWINCFLCHQCQLNTSGSALIPIYTLCSLDPSILVLLSRVELTFNPLPLLHMCPLSTRNILSMPLSPTNGFRSTPFLQICLNCF